MKTHIRFPLLMVLLCGGAVSSSQAGILREYWLGITGTQIKQLLLASDYPCRPSGWDIRSEFEAPYWWADDYGTRMRGYLSPPVTGAYVFWIAGDNQCRLYLSTDRQPENKLLIARVDDWTNFRQWDDPSEPNQESAPVYLEAGEEYYIEALQKEGDGLDCLSVAWKRPDGAFQGPIPGTALEPYFDPAPPAAAGRTLP